MSRSLLDHESFWQRLEEELAQVPLQPEERHNAFYSETDVDVFEVRYDGLGSYRLFAWLCVPRGKGPFWGLVQMPNYGSAVAVPQPGVAPGLVVLGPSHRGQRRSDTPFKAQYPGLLTHSVDSRETYIIRGVYADALRAVDFLLGECPVELRGIAVAGAGLGGTLALVAGAFRPRIRALAVDSPIMIGPPSAKINNGAYPLEEINDYLRAYPQQRKAVLDSLAVFDPITFASRVSCPVLLNVGARDRGQCPPPLGQELARNLKHGELHRYPGGTEGGGHQHAVLRRRWLKEQMRPPGNHQPSD